MSDHYTDEITARLLSGLRARIENKTTEAREHYRTGDKDWFEGNKEIAGRSYRAALIKYAEVTDLRAQLDELTADWLPVPAEAIAETRWQAVAGLEHRGVGEGDDGLPVTTGDMIPQRPGFSIPEAALVHESNERGFGRVQDPAEWEAQNPDLSGFIGPADTAAS